MRNIYLRERLAIFNSTFFASASSVIGRNFRPSGAFEAEKVGPFYKSEICPCPHGENSRKGELEEERRKKKSAPGEIRLFAGREVRLFNREEKYGRSGGRRRAFVRQKQGCACSAGGEYVCLPWEEKDEVAHRKSERRLLKGTFCACGCPAERKERLLRARRFSWGRTAFSSPGTLSWCGRLRASPRMRSEPGGISCALQLSRQPTDVRASGFPQAFLRLVFRRFQSRFKSAPKGGF